MFANDWVIFHKFQTSRSFGLVLSGEVVEKAFGALHLNFFTFASHWVYSDSMSVKMDRIGKFLIISNRFC
jgi:hypothetical protein